MFGLSAQELADQAGVARYTLLRLEAGQAVRPATLHRIRKVLFLFSDHLRRPVEPGPFAVHRKKATHWSVSIPKAEYQRRLEDDDPIHVDDPEERVRLGRLGFQPFFTAVLHSAIAKGVSHQALMEIHRDSWVDSHFGEEFVYCLRNSVRLRVDGADCVLEEGDSMCFDANLPHQYCVVEEDNPALILIVVSLRPGEKFIRRTKPEEVDEAPEG